MTTPLLNTKLMEACHINDTNKIKKLISQGVDINHIHTFAKSKGLYSVNDCTALTYACTLGNFETIQLLLENNATANILNNKALINAVYFNHLPTVDLLISYGADMYDNENYILYNSIYRGELDVIFFLFTNHNLDPQIVLKEISKIQRNNGHTFDARPATALCNKFIEIKTLKDTLERSLESDKSIIKHKI